MIAQTVIAQISESLSRAPWRGRGAILQAEAERLGVTQNTLYAHLRSFRGRTRKVRADRGAHRAEKLTAATVIAELKAKARDAVHDRNMPTEVAIAAAEQNGLIEAGTITRATADRILRQTRLSGPRRIFCRYESDRGNHLHHTDATGSKYFRVMGKDPETGDWLIGIRYGGYTRKRDVEPLGLWCVGVTDDCSRVAFGVYVVAAGESTAMMIDALAQAWSMDPRCALRGMPERLMCDHGPLRRSQEGQHFCDQMGIIFEDRMPKSPWVGGKQERPWRTQISNFELAFRLKPDATYRLSDINRMLAAWYDGRNAAAHPTHLRKSRLAVYAERLDPQSIRYIPENWHDAVLRENYRVVDASARVRYENVWYAVPDALAGRTVRIITNRDGALLCEHDGVGYPMKPFTPIVTGEYRAHADTPAMRAEKSAEALEISVVPHETAANTTHLHTGEAAPLRTAFDADAFTNQEEAIAAFCHYSGLALHMMSPEVRDLVTGILSRSESLRKEVVMELAREIRAKLA